MSLSWLKRVAALTLYFSLVACGRAGPPPVPSFPVTFVAEADPGVPLAGVTVKANGQTQGQTDAHGIAQASLRGQTGAAVSIEHECPEGYRADGETQTLRLHRFRGAGEGVTTGLQMRVQCVPTTRRIAFVVRTHDRPNLPVVLDGREVTRTNELGIAHIALRSAAGRSFRLQLNTEAEPNLKPPNPSMNFTAADRDDVFVFDQVFDEERPAPRRRVRPRSEPAPSIMRITRIP